MLSLEKKIEKYPLAKEKYVETINEYIKDGHASILSKAGAEKGQVVTNVNKAGKVRRF